MSAIYIGLALLIPTVILLIWALYDVCREDEVTAYQARKQIAQKPQAPGVRSQRRRVG